MRVSIENDIVRVIYEGQSDRQIGIRFSQEATSAIKSTVEEHGRCLVFNDVSLLANINWPFALTMATAALPYVRENVAWITLVPTGWLYGFATTIARQFGIKQHFCFTMDEAVEKSHDLAFDLRPA